MSERRHSRSRGQRGSKASKASSASRGPAAKRRAPKRPSGKRLAGLRASKGTKGPKVTKGPKGRTPPTAATRRHRIPLAVGTLVALAVLGTSFPWSALLSQHGQLAAAAAQLHTLTGENRLLAEQEQQLNSKAEIDRLAREDYQMVLPGQTLYDVLPPSGLSSSTPNGSLTGDPGSQPLVAPANAPDMTPDPGLPQGSTATGPSGTPTGNVGNSSSASGGSASGGSASGGSGDAGRTAGAPGPSSFWSRVTDTLEFLEVRPQTPGVSDDQGGSEEDRGGSEEDRAAVEALLGREPAGPFDVVVRDQDGRPAVIANSPFLFDGTPMPTRYWLVDRSLRHTVSRLESTGGAAQAEASVGADRIAAAHARYAAERDALVPSDHQGPRPSGGVGGTRRGVKCLHAHLAWWLTGADDPVGEWAAVRIGLHSA